MDLFSLAARITLDSSEYEQGLKKAEKQSSVFADVLKANIITKGVEVCVKGLARLGSAAAGVFKEAIASYADYEQLVGGVETLFKGSADKVMQYAENAYKTAGLSANEYMETVTSFSASLIASVGGDTAKAADLANQAITDMADNANKMGTDMSAIQNAYQGFAKQNYTMLDNLKLGYGGTKEEMERLVKDAAKIDKSFKYNTKTVIKNKKSVTELDMSYADIVKAIHIVQTNMGITGTTAEEAAKTITGSIGMLKAAWKNLITGMGQGDEKKLDELVNTVVDAAKTALSNVMPVAKKAIYGILHLVEAAVPVFVKEVPALLEENLPVFVDAVTALIMGVMHAIPTIIGKGIPVLIKSVVGQLPKLFKAIKNVIRNDLIPAIANLLSGGNKTIAGQNKRMLRIIFKDVLDIVGKIGSKAKEFWNRVLQPILHDIMGFMKRKVLPGIHNTLIRLKPVIDSIAKVVSDVFSKIVEYWEQTLYPILNTAFTFIVDKMIPFIIKNLDKILPIVGGIIAGIAAFSIAKKIGGIIDIVSKLFGVIMAHPFVLIIAAIGVLVGYLVHLYQTNEEARDKINAAFDAIKGFWENTLKPAFEAIYTYVVENLIPALIHWWQEELQPAIEGVFTAIAGFWTDTLQPALKALYDYVVTDLIPTLIVWWEYYLMPVVQDVFEAIKGFWEGLLKPALEELYQFVVESLIPTLIVWFEDYLQPAIKAVFEAIDSFWDTILKPVLEAIYKYVVEDLIPTLIVWWEYHLLPAIEAVFKGIKQVWEDYGRPALNALHTFVSETLPPVLDAIGKKFDYVWRHFIRPVGDWIGDTFVAVWDGLKTAMEGLLTFITGVFTGDWEKAWDGLVALVSAPFNTLATILKEPLNVVIRLVNSMIGKVEGAINTLINGINDKLSLKFEGVYIGWPINKQVASFDWSPNLQTVQWGRIKELASGGVVKPGEKALVGEYAPEMLEMIGNRAVVTPTRSTPGRLPGGTGLIDTGIQIQDRRPVTVVLELDGMQLAKAELPYMKRENQRIGVKLSTGGAY